MAEPASQALPWQEEHHLECIQLAVECCYLMNIKKLSPNFGFGQKLAPLDKINCGQNASLMKLSHIISCHVLSFLVGCQENSLILLHFYSAFTMTCFLCLNMTWSVKLAISSLCWICSGGTPRKQYMARSSSVNSEVNCKIIFQNWYFIAILSCKIYNIK